MHIIIIVEFLFIYLQIVHSLSKLKFKANFSKRIVKQQIAVRSQRSLLL